jgi:hypothetical protein
MKEMKSLNFLVFLLSATILPFLLFSQHEAITAEDYPGADVVVVFDSTVSDMQPSGLTYVDHHYLYKIMTEKGALRNNVVKISYDPLSAYVDIIKVVIHHKDGRISELDTASVMDYPQPARAIYWGAREKMIELGRLEPGDALEVWTFKKGFTYALLTDEDDERYIPPMRGHFYDIVPFYNNDPVVEKVYRVKIPADKTVQYKVYNGEVSSSSFLKNGKMVYTFEKRDIKPVKREPWMVAMSDVAPKLLISTSPDWYAKSKWFYGVNEDYGSFEWTPGIKAKVDEILEGARNEMDSVSRLTHWVADNIRYSGISMGEGEGYTLHKGDMTFTDRCGVCKDKAGMLITMLRAAGFESYAAMTMAGSRIDYIPADQFNHSVTVVKLSDGNYHLLDPTWVPFVRELWSSAEQQQQYLMGLPEGADLATTPISDPQNHFVRIFGNSELDEEGNLTGFFTIVAEGQSDASIRRMFTSYYKDRWERRLREEIRSVHPNARIIDIEMPNPYVYMNAPIKIKMEYEIPGYALVTDKEIIVNSFVGSGIFKRAMTHLYIDTGMETREYPFRDRCSRYVKLNESIKLPGSYDIHYVPVQESFADSTAYFEGGFQMSLSGETFRMNMDASFNKRIYQPEEWSSFRKAVKSQKAFMEGPFILEKTDSEE